MPRTSARLPTATLRLRGSLQAVGWAAFIVALGLEVPYTLGCLQGLPYPAEGSRLVRHALIAGAAALLTMWQPDVKDPRQVRAKP